jgi:hypothetical protein
MNVLSKSYRGPFYVVAFVLSLVATVLTSEAVVDLGLPWVGPATQAVSVLILLVQQFTPVGDA